MPLAAARLVSLSLCLLVSLCLGLPVCLSLSLPLVIINPLSSCLVSLSLSMFPCVLSLSFCVSSCASLTAFLSHQGDSGWGSEVPEAPTASSDMTTVRASSRSIIVKQDVIFLGSCIDPSEDDLELAGSPQASRDVQEHCTDQ